MEKQDITDAYLRSLMPPKTGRLEIRDTKVTGLTWRITPSGTASWSLRTRTKDGKQTRPLLGTYPAMSLSQARKAANATLAVIQGGADVVADKQAKRAERRAKADTTRTVAALMEDWQRVRSHAKESPWSMRYAGEVARTVKVDIVPKLGTKQLRDTTRADWTDLVAAKRKKAPGQAAMLYRTISAFLNYAEASGWIDTPLLPRKGAAALAPTPAPRKHILTDDELAAIWHAADREPPKLRAFVRLLILTATREMEVADMMAGEIDRAECRWTLPADRVKNKTAYTVPLCRISLAELASVWPNETPAPDHFILGRSGTSGFRGFSKLKDRLDTASKVPDWRFHDLRRTARTGMTRLGVPRDHAEAAINHISNRSALERTYDRHDYAEEVIAALGAWQRHVMELVSDRKSADCSVVLQSGSHE